MTNLEAAFDAASAAYKAAQRAIQRGGKTKRNLWELKTTSEAFDAAATAWRDEQGRDEVVALRAARLALVAPRRALNARQTSLSL